VYKRLVQRDEAGYAATEINLSYNSSTMTTSTPLLTADDLWRMPNNERRELVRGELRTMAPAGFDHGAIISNIHYLLTAHVKTNKLGVVLGAETGFLLSSSPDTVRAPDVAFVTASRVPGAGRPAGYFPGAPDLAAEVVSPRDTVEEVEDKVDEYISAGARLVWVINPKRRSVTIYQPDANPIVLRDGDALDGAGVVPGFRCAVSEIFA